MGQRKRNSLGDGGLFNCFSGGRTIESTKNCSLRSSSSSSSLSTRSSFGCSGRLNAAAAAAVVTGEEAENGRRKQRKYRKVLTKVVRSVAFLSYLNQSGGGRETGTKLLEIHLPDTSSEKSSAPSTSRSKDEDDRTMKRIFSSSSSSSLSSTSSSSLSTDPKVKPPPPCHRRRTLQRCPGNHVSGTAVFLSALGLFMILFCGKFIAVLWTCTCFYFAPRRSAMFGPAVVRRYAAVDERKHVILAGLLDQPKRV